MNSKSVGTHIDPNTKLLPNQGKSFSDSKKYKRLHVVSQFLNSPCANHWKTIIRTLKYIKGSPEKGLSYGHNYHTKTFYYSDAN